MNKLQKRGMLLVLAGLALVGAALTIHLLQRQQESLAGQSAQVLLQQLELDRTPLPTQANVESQPEATEGTDTAMPEKEYMGYSMIGSVRVPSVGIHLPVLSTWDEELLKLAPCRYSGSLPGGSMVIMGHNYRSHFTPLHSVSLGDEVIFEDVEGTVYRYRIAKIETIHRSRGDLLASHYPLTLFTCTPGGLERLVIRCEQLG